MGEFITLPSVQGLCPHKLSTHSTKQFFLGGGNDVLVLVVASHEVRSMQWSELEVIYCSATIFGFNSQFVEHLIQYLFPKVFILFSIFYHGGKTNGWFEYSSFLDRWIMVHEGEEIASFGEVVYVFKFNILVGMISGGNREWSVGLSRWWSLCVMFQVCVNNNVCRLDFLISFSLRGCL
jgi:hypothetical protein